MSVSTTHFECVLILNFAKNIGLDLPSTCRTKQTIRRRMAFGRCGIVESEKESDAMLHACVSMRLPQQYPHVSTSPENLQDLRDAWRFTFPDVFDLQMIAAANEGTQLPMGSEVDAIALSRERNSFDLWAWLIMPEHVHLALCPHEGTNIAGSYFAHVRYADETSPVDVNEAVQVPFEPRMNANFMIVLFAFICVHSRFLNITAVATQPVSTQVLDA